MYTVTITFPELKINSSDIYQLIMALEIDLSGSDVSVDAKDHGLLVTDPGTLEWRYGVDEGLLIPGMINLALADNEGYLDDYLFGSGAAALACDKQIKIEILLNGSKDFIGYLLEETITSHTDNKTISFRAAPKIDILKKQMLYNADSRCLDPLDYTTYSSFGITAASYAAGEVTISHVPTSTDFQVGATVKIKEVEGMTDINGSWRVASHLDNNRFKIAVVTDQTRTGGGTATRIGGGSLRKLSTVLRDIFRLVNSDINYPANLELNHGWIFEAGYAFVTITGASCSGGITTVTHNADASFVAGRTIIIEEVEGMTDLNAEFVVVSHVDNNHFTVTLDTTQNYTSGGKARVIYTGDISDIYIYDSNLFFTTNYDTIGNLLKSLAKDLFAFTGMIHTEKAFFRKLFYYDASNLQTLEEPVVLFEKNYKFPILDYIKMATTDDNTRQYEAGTYTELKDRFLVRDDVLTSFYKDDTGGYSNIQMDTPGGTRAVWYAKDEVIDDAYNAYYSNLYLLAQLWYYFRGNVIHGRVDHFIVNGVNYDFLKNFHYGGFKYQPVFLRKLFNKNKSVIDAFYLGAV